MSDVLKSSWTVIGFWNSTGTVWSETYDAVDQHDAFAQAARDVCGDEDMEFVAAVHRDCEVWTPCEDAWKTACAADIDYKAEEDDEEAAG
jgi:hypothetical protein